MKLFYAPGACSLSPHIVLNEAGLKFDKVKVDTKSKAMEGGDYRSINPLGYVPALELDDGTILTEGPAIVQWIADKVPDKQLAPASGSLERTKLQSWLNFISTELHKGFSPLFNPNMPDAAKQVFRERLATRFQHLDKHLADNDYLMGKAFSVADAYLFTVSNWAAHTGVDLSGFANVLAYRKRVGARAAVQAAMQAEGLIK
ncbi:MAG TPA: glutathione transferase GstA [Hyphomicrobiaceae bacterium]|jgi:glutathione S-transferase|nr:glutathione transferase GstA [Hyphomicrobiaceae bacterium]